MLRYVFNLNFKKSYLYETYAEETQIPLGHMYIYLSAYAGYLAMNRGEFPESRMNELISNLFKAGQL